MRLFFNCTFGTAPHPPNSVGILEKPLAASVSASLDVSRNGGVSWSESPFSPSAGFALPQQMMV
jgi:hypothetical protein